jgi:hypothetical protein
MLWPGLVAQRQSARWISVRSVGSAPALAHRALSPKLGGHPYVVRKRARHRLRLFTIGLGTIRSAYVARGCHRVASPREVTKMEQTKHEILVRHVREGQERVVQQEALIGYLEGRGHSAILAPARRLLREMLCTQAHAEKHLTDWLSRNSIKI